MEKTDEGVIREEEEKKIADERVVERRKRERKMAIRWRRR